MSPSLCEKISQNGQKLAVLWQFKVLMTRAQPKCLMDDVHLLTARHFCFDGRCLSPDSSPLSLRGGKIFSSKFGAREVCIAPQTAGLIKIKIIDEYHPSKKYVEISFLKYQISNHMLNEI